MFINLSNHKAVGWSKEQLDAAGKWGEVVSYNTSALRILGAG